MYVDCHYNLFSLQDALDEKYLPSDEIWLYDPDNGTWYVYVFVNHYSADALLYCCCCDIEGYAIEHTSVTNGKGMVLDIVPLNDAQ